MTSARLQWLSFVTGWASMLAVLAMTIYFGVIARPWLSYRNLPFPVLTASVKPGQAVHLAVERCNSDDSQHVYVVAHTLVPLGHEGRRPYVLPGDATELQPGCEKIVSTLNVIPLGVPPGRYLIRGTAELPGGFGGWVISWVSQPFEVAPP